MSEVNPNENSLNEKYTLTPRLKDNINLFKDIFKNDNTVIYRYFENKTSTINYCLIFIDGMVSRDVINENILLPLLNYDVKSTLEKDNIINSLMKKVLLVDDLNKLSNMDEIVTRLVYGDALLLVEGHDEALILNTKGWEKKSIADPKSEAVVRGPREAFTESIITNLSLIRRKIKSHELKFKFKEIGYMTKTTVCICYIEGIAQDDILNELEKRLDEIKIDGILDSGYIEEFIRDEPFSPFKTIGSTERPDTAAGKLLEGRIVVICDGTPIVLTLPFLFVEFFQVNEDYYNNFIYASFNRILRIIGFFLATSVPAIYVALTTYHQELIPTPLALSIYNSREGVPFPTFVEAILMLLTFEILREAGVRLPKPIGQAVSIVGALVLGEAAVAASLISAPMVIVTAITGISSFLLPKMINGLIIVRVIFLLTSSFLGLYGYIFSIIGLFIHLMAMKSFGVYYMLYLTSFTKKDIQDIGIRMPWWYMKYRTKIVAKNPFHSAKDYDIRKRIKTKE